MFQVCETEGDVLRGIELAGPIAIPTKKKDLQEIATRNPLPSEEDHGQSAHRQKQHRLVLETGLVPIEHIMEEERTRQSSLRRRLLD